MKFRPSALAASIAILSAALSAHASSIATYTLSNVGLTYGINRIPDGTLNGTFTFNTATGYLLTADIVASPGAAPAPYAGGGYEYIYGTSNANSSAVTGYSNVFTLISIANPTNGMIMTFKAPLDGSSSVPIDTGTAEGEGAPAGGRSVGIGFFVNLNPGVTPEPSSIVLLGTGIFSLGGLLRRRRT